MAWRPGAAATDEERFFAPLVCELFLPFISVLRLIHFLNERPALRRRLHAFVAGFVALTGIRPGEVAQRHPMGLFKEDEDDICLTV